MLIRCMRRDGSDVYEVREHGTTLLKVLAHMMNDICGLHVLMIAPIDERVMEAFCRLLERVIKDTHCARILLDHKENVIEPAKRVGFTDCAYGLIKEVDPLRKVIPDRCFDELGFLNRQEDLLRIPYGAFDVSRCGCAAIAVYNLLHSLCEKDDLSEIFATLGKASLLKQSFGTNLVFLRADLKRRGIDTSFHLCTKKHSIRLRPNDRGILLYMHRHGGHYVMFCVDENGMATFYNAVQGRDALRLCPEDFYDRYIFLPVFCVLKAERLYV